MKKTYSSLSNHNEAKLSPSSSTIGLDAQPSARPTALQSSRLMGLDSVPSSIAAHSTISTRYAVSYAIPTLPRTSDWRISISVSNFHFHFHFPFPVSIPLPFPAFLYALYLWVLLHDSSILRLSVIPLLYCRVQIEHHPFLNYLPIGVIQIEPPCTVIQ